MFTYNIANTKGNNFDSKLVIKLMIFHLNHIYLLYFGFTFYAYIVLTKVFLILLHHSSGKCKKSQTEYM